MNAAAPASLAEAALAPAPDSQQIPLAGIELSRTHIQELRRARFDAAALADLAASVKGMGVLQPILVRPAFTVRVHHAGTGLLWYPEILNVAGNWNIQGTGHKTKEEAEAEAAQLAASYEIVAGERRYLAAKTAGLATVPGIVRTLTDLQVIEIQLVENVQREGLHPLDEAVGYHDLMQLGKLKAEEVGAKLGKSRSWVYNRLKLMDLCPEARKALNEGKLMLSVAELIARIGHHDTQRQATADLASNFGDSLTFRKAQDYIRENYTVELKGVAFGLADAALLPKAGPCTACPKRSGNQKDLVTDIKNPNVCTDPKCLEAKTAAVAARKRAELEAKGETVIAGKEARKLKPQSHSKVSGGYVELDREEYLGGKFQTVRQALGKDVPPEQLLEDPDTHKLVPIAKADEVGKALKSKHIQVGFGGRSGGDGRQKAAERKARVETAARVAILQAIRIENRARRFDLDDTILVAEAMFRRLDFDSSKRLVDALMLEAGTPKPKGHEYVGAFAKTIPAMSAAELGPLLLDMALIGDCHVASYNAGSKPKELHGVATRLKLDQTKIRAEVQAGFAAKTAAKKPPKQKSKPKEKKS